MPEIRVARRDQWVGGCPVTEVDVGYKLTLVESGSLVGIGLIIFQEPQSVGDFFGRWIGFVFIDRIIGGWIIGGWIIGGWIIGGWISRRRSGELIIGVRAYVALASHVDECIACASNV